MWGKFWFMAQRQAGDAEVRNAGSAAPMPEQSSPADKAPRTEDQADEIAEFLARVYTNQQC